MRASTRSEKEKGKKRRGGEREEEKETMETKKKTKKTASSLNLSDDLEGQVLLAAATLAAALAGPLAGSRDVGLDLVLGHRVFLLVLRGEWPWRKKGKRSRAEKKEEKVRKNEKNGFFDFPRSLFDFFSS